MGKYAQQTEVTTDRSKAEIERTLARYGATAFGYMWQGSTAVVVFQMRGRRVQFRLAMPPRSQFELTESGRERTSDAAIDSAWEQAQRQRWRALLLVIKAKLEAVEAGITSYEDEFLANTVLPDGGTVSQWVQPQVKWAYEHNEMPALMSGVPESALALPSANGHAKD